MSKVVQEVLSANADYTADFGDKGALPMPPGRQFAIAAGCLRPRPRCFVPARDVSSKKQTAQRKPGFSGRITPKSQNRTQEQRVADAPRRAI